MSRPTCMCAQRPGAIAPLASLTSIVLLGMVAFAVDTSWIVLTRSELQNAADSAALAGAGQLMNGYVQYNLPTQTANQKATILSSALTSAAAAAKQYAATNAAGGVTALALKDADVQIGFVDQSGKFTVSTSSGPYPNTVKVLMRRDGTANQPLKLFFAPVFGVSTANVNAAASATCFAATYNSFSPATGLNVGMLPVTYDVNHWNNFLSTGKDPDGNISTDKNGNPVLQVYPSVSSPGNFGELSLNDSHNGASTTANWIASGVPSNDLQALMDHSLLPLSQHPANTWDWQGNPGFKASNVMEINGQVGKTYLLPLFQPVAASSSNNQNGNGGNNQNGNGQAGNNQNGNGQGTSYQAGTGQGANYFYDIVAFVSVTIMPAPNNNQQIIVQPGAYIDPSAVFAAGTVVPMGTTSSLTTTFAAPKLTN